MAVQLKFAAKSWDRSEKALSCSEVYYSISETEIDAFISTLAIGGYYGGKGTLSRYRKSPDSVYWNVELSYLQEWSDDGVQTNPDTATGPNSQRLTCRMLSLPLESKKDRQGKKLYRTCWNHFLIGLGEAAVNVPGFWETAQDPFIDPSSDDFKIYRWVKSLSEIPTEKDEETGSYWQVVKGGTGEDAAACTPTMEGIESFDYAVYQITETGRHSSKNRAGWAAAQLANSIVAAPMLGDFGLTAKLGGNWKVDDCDVYYDGRYWMATVTYTKSGDAQGWNRILYGED